MWNIIQFTFPEIVCGACWVFPILIICWSLSKTFQIHYWLPLSKKNIFSLYWFERWKLKSIYCLFVKLQVSTHFALRTLNSFRWTLQNLAQLCLSLWCAVDIYWRARGCEIVEEYSSREIIVLDLTNFPKNCSSRRPYWLFPTLS